VNPIPATHIRPAGINIFLVSAMRTSGIYNYDNMNMPTQIKVTCHLLKFNEKY
jgi:hypothetical protein